MKQSKLVMVSTLLSLLKLLAPSVKTESLVELVMP
jgi:hypothetical protein